MTTTQWIAQAIGLLGIAVFLFTYHGKNVKQMVKVKLAVDIIWGVHYLLLGAIGGFATNVICIMREIVLLNNNKRFFNNKLWLVFFMLINWIVAIFSNKGIPGLIPAMATTLATWSFWHDNPQKARIIGMTNNVMMFIYDIFVLSYTGLVAESLSFCSVMVAYFRNRCTKSELKK